MEIEEQDVTSGGNGEPTNEQKSVSTEQVDPARANLVKAWCAKVADSKKHFEKDFERMRTCMQLARDGASEEWVKGDNYTVPILNRHINQQVSQLYAKHPKAVVKTRPKRYFKVWDGKPETAAAAMQLAPMGDEQSLAILNEVATAKQEIQLYENLARTLEIVDDYFMSEQSKNYKAQIKKMVRRTKVTGVGYIRLDFQRTLGAAPPDPDRDAQIDDIRSKIERIEEITSAGQLDMLDEDSAEIEELRSNLADLEAANEIIVREGPVLGFPRSTQVIIDKACHHLKTLAGAGWIAYEYDMTPERIHSIYGVDVSKEHKSYESKPGEKQADNKATCKVWQIHDKINQQVMTVCDGYCDFLRAPKTPDIQIDGFFNLFPLVFNETEEDEGGTIYPPSDVWLARHAQEEYNRSREGLREHRIASRPWYAMLKGILEGSDKDKLSNHAAHEVVELNVPADSNADIAKIIQRGPTISIDPNQYETETIFQDIQRAIGSQEANIGGVSGATATESSIAESSRMSALEDNIDDLDEFLSALARAKGQIYLLELDEQTVMEIAGPGAVWPSLTREQISKDLLLDIKAGSSGKPNKAAELANLERAMPFLIQMQGVPAEPLAERYLALLDIDVEQAIVEGLPSITAINAALGSAQPGTGDPATDPNAQGAEGQQNAPVAAGTDDSPQPAYPA